MAKSYAERLKDPRWQQVRLRIMERDGWACTKCGCKTDTLNVHHGAYLRGLDPWDYPPETLWTLCDPCHEWVGEVMEQINRDISEIVPGAGLVVLANEINDLKWKLAAVIAPVGG